MHQITWLVTGCSSGFGEILIKRILARGDKAIATTRGSVSRINTLARAGAKTYTLDVTASPAEIHAITAQILKENEQIDVLVNNAGYIEAGMAEDISYESYLAQFETNFFGIVKVTQAILPHFRERKSGMIMMMSSLGGIAGSPGASAYCASKFALEGWTESLRQEIAPFNIQTITFEPGFHRTKIMHPDNVHIPSLPDTSIADYDEIRKMTNEFVKGMDGNQSGDPVKAVDIMIDVVKGEGVAKGKTKPERLPIGKGMMDALRKKCNEGLEICGEWGDIVEGTDFDA